MAHDIRQAGHISEQDGGAEKRFLQYVSASLPDDYVIIVGLVIPPVAGGQIDAIVIGPPGIWVLEIKNWAGSWKGGEHWYRGTEKRRNPLFDARRKRDERLLPYLLKLKQSASVLYRADSRDQFRIWIGYAVVCMHPQMDTTGISDPSKSSCLIRLEDVSPDGFKKMRGTWTTNINGYLEAKAIADLIYTAPTREMLAIDFGTSYSAVALYPPAGNEEIFSDGFGELIPSIFGYQGRNEHVGRAAKREIARGALDLKNVVTSIKTFLGLSQKEFNDISRLKPPSAEYSKNGIRFKLGGKWFSTVEISGKILGHLKAIAEERTTRPWQSGLISVPARFDQEQRTQVLEAAKLAGFTFVHLVDEPTAAALAFGYNYRYQGTLAVYDLGGGTFDISIVAIRAGGWSEIVKLGIPVGGDDFDAVLMRHFIARFNNRFPGSMSNLTSREQFRLQEAVERIKFGLSSSTNETLILDNWRTYGDLTYDISRERFDRLVADLIDRTIFLCQDALEDHKTSIDDVLLVGGSTFVPLVKRKVEGFFGKPPRSDMDPSKAIIKGVAIRSGMMMGRVKDAKVITRVSPATFGVTVSTWICSIDNKSSRLSINKLPDYCDDDKLTSATSKLATYEGKAVDIDTIRDLLKAINVQEQKNTDTHEFRLADRILGPLIGLNDVIEDESGPRTFKERFSTVVDNQTEIRLEICESQRKRSTWLYTKDKDCKLLSSGEIVTLNTAGPAYQNGLEINFQIDQDGRLKVSYSELRDPTNVGHFEITLLWSYSTVELDDATHRPVKYRGKVRWFNHDRGYGFISRDEGDSIFVHSSGIVGEGFRTLNEGDQVQFNIGQGRKGPIAVNVVPV